MKKFHILVTSLTMTLSSIAWSQSQEVQETGIVIAKSKRNKAAGTREKRIVREERYKAKSSNDKTELDFDSVDIGGERKTPLGSLVGRSKADTGYDFIKIRLRWHPEMIQSASSLEAEND